MTRVNFREIRDRFTHIDARFVSCRLGFKGEVSSYTVSLYPWWEHPSYVEAITTGKPWGSVQCEDGRKEVTVFPLGLKEFKLTQCDDVIDWSFCESHPLLWPYEDCGEIICNSQPPLDELFGRTCKTLGVWPRELYPYLDPLLSYKAPFSLGKLPFTLFGVVEGVLAELGVSFFIPRRPQARTTPILLFIDGSDYIIADDCEIDVPEFEHRPEWFKPA